MQRRCEQRRLCAVSHDGIVAVRRSFPFLFCELNTSRYYTKMKECHFLAVGSNACVAVFSVACVQRRMTTLLL